MRKGQVGIGLVILGVIAIIAVIGLVLLFTRASKTAQGAMLTDLSIGNAYGSGNVPGLGIGETYPSPKFIREQGGSVPAQPEIAYPAYVGKAYATKSTSGSRTPAFVITGVGAEGGFASIENIYACENDLILSGIPVPHDLYNAYTVPNKGVGTIATGWYPPDSSAEARPTRDYIGKTGGDVYMYMNSVGSEQTMPDKSADDLNRELILTKLVYGDVSTARHPWSTVSINGKIVPVCWISKETFPFRQ
ncbi:Uncharacterised protein [uncultured archaeon]|nr:Uncharacterised protein [uncultured archaeon]